MTPPLPLRVVKVGGSLLDWNGLAVALNTWIGQQSPAVNVLIAGGGKWAEEIRRADAAYGLGETEAHWLSVDALSFTAQRLGEIASLPIVTRDPQLFYAEIPSACVFDPAPFLHDLEHCLFETPLPHAWAVTSDSIAARIAEHLAASELVLLKSCLPGAATTAYVDDYFSFAAANLPAIRCVNLRSASFEATLWPRRS